MGGVIENNIGECSLEALRVALDEARKALGGGIAGFNSPRELAYRGVVKALKIASALEERDRLLASVEREFDKGVY